MAGITLTSQGYDAKKYSNSRRFTMLIKRGIWKELPKVSTTTELIPIEKLKQYLKQQYKRLLEEQVQ